MKGNKEFIKKKDYIICIDSDGCAMNTMNMKHMNCFGPELVKEWGIENEEDFIHVWNKVNLFSGTRGINRFKGFVLSFKEMQAAGKKIGEIDQIEKWISDTDELSNRSLSKEIEDMAGKVEEEKLEQLRKLLRWSENVNEGIRKLEGIDAPFPNVKEAFEKLSMKVDIAAVSSANREALLSEWERHGLMAYTDIVYSQEEGSKKDCIGRVKQFGYDNDRILMVGDSPGDLEAAEDNGVLFFPILFDNEAKCWKEITGTALEKFMEGTYRGEYQRMLIEEFKRNLSDEDPTFLSLKK